MSTIQLQLTAIKKQYRLLVSLVAGLIIFFAAHLFFDRALSLLFAWIGFSATLLCFFWFTILVRHPSNVGLVASEEDTGYWALMLIILVASFASVFAVILFLQQGKQINLSMARWRTALSIMAVALSWLLIHTLFTIRYADLYYRNISKKAVSGAIIDKGFAFPKSDTPNLLDFAYVAFGIGMTCQVADVNVTNSLFRGLVLVHSIIAFVYNTAIIALSINLLSGLLSN